MLSSSYRPNPYCAFSLLFPLPLYKKTVDHNNKMLRRNRFGFRMRRRSLSGRLFQFVVVLTVVSLFIYLLLYTAHFKNDIYGPDFHWLKTRNVSFCISLSEFSQNYKIRFFFCRCQNSCGLRSKPFYVSPIIPFVNLRTNYDF